MTNKQIITLSGFGDFYENDDGLMDLFNKAKEHNIECYATYYDHELKGDADTIEQITKELWGMSRDEWAENALIEEVIN